MITVGDHTEYSVTHPQKLRNNNLMLPAPHNAVVRAEEYAIMRILHLKLEIAQFGLSDLGYRFNLLYL
jgi:hypothetical protein